MRSSRRLTVGGSTTTDAAPWPSVTATSSSATRTRSPRCVSRAAYSPRAAIRVSHIKSSTRPRTSTLWTPYTKAVLRHCSEGRNCGPSQDQDERSKSPWCEDSEDRAEAGQNLQACQERGEAWHSGCFKTCCSTRASCRTGALSLLQEVRRQERHVLFRLQDRHL